MDSFDIVTAWYRADRPVEFSKWLTWDDIQRKTFVTASEYVHRRRALELAYTLQSPEHMAQPIDGGESLRRAQLMAAMEAEVKRRDG